MKIAGIVMTVLGGLLVLSGLNVALTQYNLNDSHDVSKALGGFGFVVVILAIGVSLLLMSRAKRWLHNQPLQSIRRPRRLS